MVKNNFLIKTEFLLFLIVLLSAGFIFKTVLSLDIRGSFRVGNAPPSLVSGIPNQTWSMNAQKTGLDLDDYFIDPDGDNITYNVSTSDNPHINISINSDNNVTFTPENRWNGTEHVVFYASDGIWDATSSNNITLRVLYVNTQPIISASTPLSIRFNISENNNQTFTINITDHEQDVLNVTWKVNGTIVQTSTYLLSSPGYNNLSTYIFTTNYSSASDYNVTVFVSDGDLASTRQPWIVNVTDINRKPYFYRNISNISWSQGNSYTLDSLDNYATDPDLSIDDSLSYSYTALASLSNITVRIDSITHKVIFRPYSFFYGTETFYFKVQDSKSAYNYSNNITVTITQASSSSSSGTPSNSSGSKYEDCENYYSCSSWSRCSPYSKTRTRTCIDLAECAYRVNPPAEKETCEYMPSCYNKIQDNDEDAIDCGGPCEPCWTCYDGIQNQGEDDIDCGGPCKSCATCDDGIKNCQKIDSNTLICEDDIDCGGPCDPCEMFSPMNLLMASLPYIIGLFALLFISGSLLAAYKIFLPKLKKKENISQSSICLKDMIKIQKELHKIEKNISKINVRDLTTDLTNMLHAIVSCLFKIEGHYTQKELREKLTKIKGERVLTEIVYEIYSKLYDMKFSGKEIYREDLLNISDELNIIAALEIERLSNDELAKKTHLTKLYKLYLEWFESFHMGKMKKSAKIHEYIEQLEKTMPHEEVAKIRSSSIHKKFMILSPKITQKEDTAKINKKESAKQLQHRHFEHHVSTMVFILIMAGLIGMFLLKGPLLNIPADYASGNMISGLVVYDENNESINLTEEPINEINQQEYNPIEPAEVPVEEPIIEEPLLDEQPPADNPPRMGVMSDTRAPTWVYPEHNQVLTSTEDNYSSWLLIGNHTNSSVYPLTFQFTNGQTGVFIWPIVSQIGIVNYNDTAAWLNFTPNETYVWDSNRNVDDYKIHIDLRGNDTISVGYDFIFNVTNINDAPTIPTHTPSSLTPSVAENSSLTFTYDNTTADPDQIHPGIESVNQTWFLDGTLNTTNRSWSYMPGICDAGTHTVSLNVTDIAGLNGTKTWTVTVNNTNRAPYNNKTFSGYENITWQEESNVTNNLTLYQFFNDTDHEQCTGSNQDNLTFGYEVVSINSVNNSKPINVSINSASSNISFYPRSDWYGVEVIRLFANDSYTITYSDINITLNVTNVNDAPVLTAIPDQNATTSTLFTYNVIATDPDNDTLTYTDNTSLFNISNTTGVISFTPANDDVGNYSIRINVSDPSGLSGSIVFNLTVRLGNRAPTIDRIYPYGKPLSETLVFDFANSSSFTGSTTSFNTSEDTTITFNHTSIDLDGNTLNCTWYLDSILVKNESCTNISYWIYGINFTQSGTRNITAVVNDNGNSTDTTDSFTWNVSIINVNRATTFGQKLLTSYSDFSSGTINQTNITFQLGNITLAKSDGTNYYYNGTYLSSVINLQASYDKTNITSLIWSKTQPSGTNIFVRVKTANDSTNLASAAWSSYSNLTQINLTTEKTNYVQFEINLSTNDVAISPTLENLTINYQIQQYEDITGNINSWIDLDHYFSDLDTDDTINYGYEILSGASIIGLSIDNSDNTVDFEASESGTASFRFSANDSYSSIYSNNITVTMDIYEAPTTTVVSGGGGGGGGATKTKIKIIDNPQPYYLQLVHVKPLEVIENRELLSPSKDAEGKDIQSSSVTTFRAPIILNNTANETLSGIHLSAKTNVPGISFEFKQPEIESIEQQTSIATELYITQSNSITGAYSVDIIADIDDPQSEDITTININPLSNISKKVQSVMDMIKLNPICRELEEVVVKAQSAIQIKNYNEAEKLLEDAISGCKYLIAASQKDQSELPKKSFVLSSLWIYIAGGIFLLGLTAAYIVPSIVNRVKLKKFQKNNKKNRNKKI